jgi:hypothetical protein
MSHDKNIEQTSDLPARDTESCELSPEQLDEANGGFGPLAGLVVRSVVRAGVGAAAEWWRHRR